MTEFTTIGRVKKVSTEGFVTTIAGGGVVIGDNGPATAAAMSTPWGIAGDTANNLFIGE